MRSASAEVRIDEASFEVASVGTAKRAESTRKEMARTVEVLGAGRPNVPERRRSAEHPDVAPARAAVSRVGADLKPGAETRPLPSRLGFSIRGGEGKGGLSVPLTLARYSGGDWDCSLTAMMYLAHQLEERTGLAIEASDRVVQISDPALMKVPFVYMTGHKDFVFTEAEVRNLRKYLEKGGYLWVDDSTHFNDNSFDSAFRREMARVLPGTSVVKLGRDFAGFRTGYDLARGYKGYAVPPGDKYRLDYLEGIRIKNRMAIVYTRNDYGDGLDIDPNTHPLMPSLTDLSPAEMQEGVVVLEKRRVGSRTVLLLGRRR